MTWSKRFAEYMHEHDIDRDEAALALGVSVTTVHYWMHGATARRERRKAVERWTKGAVPSNLANVIPAAESSSRPLAKSAHRPRSRARKSEVA